MNISQENAERLQELFEEINERVNEFKHICRQSMSNGEYEQFRYRTLGNLEPAIALDQPWVTTYSSIDCLEEVAQKALDSVEEVDEETDGEE